MAMKSSCSLTTTSSSSSRHKRTSRTSAGTNSGQESLLSGAYIRSLVKHLTSQRQQQQQHHNHHQHPIPRPPAAELGPSVMPCCDANRITAQISGETQKPAADSAAAEVLENQEQQQQQQQQQQEEEEQVLMVSSRKKKQVRRRPHSRRSSHAAVVNIAEARREIVNALRLHRAAHGSPPVAAAATATASSATHRRQSFKPTKVAATASVKVSGASPFHQDLNHAVRTRAICPSPSWSSSSNTYISNWAPNQPPHLAVLPVSQSLQPQLAMESMNFSMEMNMSTINGGGGAGGVVGCDPVAAQSTSSFSSFSSVNKRNWHVAMDEKELAEIKFLGQVHDMEWNDSLNVAAAAASQWWDWLCDWDDTAYHELQLPESEINSSSKPLVDQDAAGASVESLWVDELLHHHEFCLGPAKAYDHTRDFW